MTHDMIVGDENDASGGPNQSNPDVGLVPERRCKGVANVGPGWGCLSFISQGRGKLLG